VTTFRTGSHCKFRPNTEGIVQNIEKTIVTTGQKTEVVLNEFIPFINDWCNCTGLESLCGNEVLPANCPDWQKQSTAGGDHNLANMKGLGYGALSC
jgi:hypothetical protein